ncbi:hypothetical protein ACKUCE_11865 [Flavobacterium psychrophilum]|uniref:hypothetical protein n=5 Tax=Flavobacterium psychrophilum TaxID=96345 RepID=UPI001249BDF9|nr:hypothetical protein [Flavobacterium psychrophilum]EKT4537800.1 hypothetical protein [Flavobacterium psychrophilum]
MNFILSIYRLFRVKLLVTSPRFAGFSRELALEENLAKRVMEEHRAKATMVFHRPRSGGSMEKIVPKGDFFHRPRATRRLGLIIFIFLFCQISADIPNL